MVPYNDRDKFVTHVRVGYGGKEPSFKVISEKSKSSF